MKLFKIFTSGMLVGAADLIPGISGGTIAFIIGIYEELLRSIGSLNKNSLSLLIRGKFRDFFKVVSWKFLVVFLAGQGTALILFAKGFNLLLNAEPYRTLLYATMMGLVLGSVSFCFRKIGDFGRSSFVFFVIGVITAFSITKGDFKSKELTYDIPRKDLGELRVKNIDGSLIKEVPQSEIVGLISKKYLEKDSVIERNIDGKLLYAGEIVKLSYVDYYILIAGIMAACAMLLPGISGSYLLTVLGMYGIVLGAFVEFVDGIKRGSFDMHSFRIVVSLGIGIVIGAVVFSHVVNFLLEKYRSNTLSTLTGFMIGSLGAVYPFVKSITIYSPMQGKCLLKQESIYLPNLLSYEFVMVVIFMFVGFYTVIKLESYAKRKAIPE